MLNSWVKIGLLAALGAALAAAAGAAWFWQWSRAPLPLAEAQVVLLEPGRSFKAFARDLAQAGVTERPRLLAALARLRGDAHRVKAGEYRIEAGTTPLQLLDDLVQARVLTYQLRFVEGWTTAQVLAVLAADGRLARRLDGVDVTTVLGAIGLPPGHGEGLFFPDTYQFVRGDSDADILRRAYDRMQEALAAVWQERDSGLPYETPYEALIVASLIEKETGRPADRGKIAQVFVRRLQYGMRLQTDPSVIYGLGRAFDGNLTRAHLRSDTPYNTYTRAGLPPTPIALPGSESLAAAVHPAEGEYLYFVSRGDGSSEFSLSLEEHQAAVRRYQLQ